MSKKHGVVIAAEKKVTSKLLAKPKNSEKLYTIDDHIACAVAGLTADANVLVDYLRRVAASHRVQYGEAISMEDLIKRVCDLKQGYTQFGGQRPFGVSFLYAGYDAHNGFQLYRSDPSGNYGGWKATAIGANNQAASSLLKTEYAEDLELDALLELSVKVLTKTMDTTTPTADKMEFTVIRSTPEGALVQETIEESRVQKILDDIKAEEEKDSKGDE